MRRRRWVLLLALLLSTSGVQAARAQQSARYFVETSHYLYESALSYWTEYGGLPVFGSPISERLEAERGAAGTAQYSEHARMENNANSPAPYNVLLGRLGVELLERQGRQWEDFPRAAPGA